MYAKDLFRAAAHSYALLLICATVLVMAGCSGTQHPELVSATQHDNVTGIAVELPSSGLPAFPADKQTAGLTEQLIAGKAAEQKSVGAVEHGSALVLNSTIGGPEYALYRFNPAGSAPDSVSVLLDDTNTTGAFIGLANYNSQRWDFFGPYTSQKSFAVDELKYLSALGNVWVAVLSASGQSATVSALSVRAISPANEPPTAVLLADSGGGDAPHTIEFDASGSSDPDGQIIEYAWDFNGDGLYDGFSDDPVVSRLYTAPGSFSVKVRVTDEHFDRATATTDIAINVVGNELPVAAFETSVSAGTVPLLVDFNAGQSSDPDGSIVNYEWDFDGDGHYDVYGPQGSSSFTYTDSNGGDVRPHLRVTDNSGAQAMAQLQILLNEPPLAVLTATKVEGQPGDYIFFSAADSFDPDGTIVNYKWDTQGEGFHETDTGATPSINFLFQEPGKRDFGLLVTDEHGGTAKASLSITIHGWVHFSVDTDCYYGGNTSLAVVNGKPAIAYRGGGFGQNHLRYARSSTVLGSNAGDWEYLTVDSNGLTGNNPSLLEVAGRPAIAYGLNIDSNLRYARASNGSGVGPDAGWGVITVNANMNTGFQSSLAVVAGNPAIAHYTTDGFKLLYVRSVTATGALAAHWTQAVTVDSAASVAGGCSMLVVAGKPAISYKISGTHDLCYARAETTTGQNAGDWVKLTVDSSVHCGQGTSLAIVQGCPAIAYYDSQTKWIKYVRSTDPLGTMAGHWTQLVDVSPLGSAITPLGLCVVDGRPMIGHYDPNDIVGRWAASTTLTGSSNSDWSIGGVVDPTGSSGIGCTVANVNGQLAMSYYYPEESATRYAVLF